MFLSTSGRGWLEAVVKVFREYRIVLGQLRDPNAKYLLDFVWSVGVSVLRAE